MASTTPSILVFVTSREPNTGSTCTRQTESRARSVAPRTVLTFRLRSRLNTSRHVWTMARTARPRRGRSTAPSSRPARRRTAACRAAVSGTSAVAPSPPTISFVRKASRRPRLVPAGFADERPLLELPGTAPPLSEPPPPPPPHHAFDGSSNGCRAAHRSPLGRRRRRAAPKAEWLSYPTIPTPERVPTPDLCRSAECSILSLLNRPTRQRMEHSESRRTLSSQT